MIRVAYVITDSGVGGSEAVLSHLLSLLNQSLVKPVGIIVLKNRRENGAQWEKLGIPVLYLGSRKVPTPRILFSLKRYLQEWNPDLVHAFLFHSVQLVRIAKWMGINSKIISSPRVNYRFAPGWARWLDSKLKSWDSGVLSESNASAQFLVASSGYASEKMFIVPNGVEQSRFSFSEEKRKAIRSQWRVSDSEVLIGGVGRLHPQKGFDVLLEALNLLKGLKIKPRTFLFGEGPEKESLQRQSSDLLLDVVLAGQESRMNEVYSGLDIFVQSSRYEGMSNALLEAMAAGRACVATAVDGTMDLAQDGVNMLLVKPEDPVSLSVAIGLLLEKPELRKKLSEGAAATAKQFSLDRMVREFERVYLSVAQR